MPSTSGTRGSRESVMLALLLCLAFSTLRSFAFMLDDGAINGPPRRIGSGSKPSPAVGELAFAGGSSLVAGKDSLSRGCRSYRRKGRADVCTMALKHKLKRPRNKPGDFSVDESCVDCDICSWMDPRTYKRSGLGAIVASQPKTEEERMAAFQAMLACPAGSIRTMRPDRQVIEALASFPLPVDEKRLPGVYQLAPTTRESMGNTPYLIVRPGKGNIMIDVPRYLRKTAEKLEALGGVKYLIVTGRDKSIGHEKWKKRFPGMVRVLHRLDLARKTRVMEERLDGKGPWYLVKHGEESKEAGYVTGATARFDFSKAPEDERAPNDPTVKIVGMPGQTRGSVGVVYDMGEGKDGVVERLAFSGGSVGFSVSLKKLDTFPRTVETDKETLAASVRRLAEEGITSLLPGRGARVLFDSAEEAQAELEAAAGRLAAVPDLMSNRMLIDPRYS